MGKKIIEIVAEDTMNELVRILKECRKAGKNLDDVIAGFEKKEANKDAVIVATSGKKSSLS